MKIGVVTFLGSLDDYDAQRAVRIAGADAVPLWHGDPDLKGVDAVILPGGFSYGDYLRCGAIARFAPVMASIADAAKGGLPVLGICNGFQVLCEAHLLPGALTRNAHLHYRMRDQRIRVESVSTRWTSAFRLGQDLVVPIKHGEGRYVADERTLDALEAEGRVVARYVDNPNGSMRDIASVTNEAGNVVGMMPHPEHAIDPLTGPSSDGLGYFASILGFAAKIGAAGMTFIDTVEHAASTPGAEQPYQQLGLQADEYEKVRQILGRRPTDSELYMYSIMWSEHCSYKSSKMHLRQFGEKAPPSDLLLAGMGENAGVIKISDKLAVTFKVESHNHPSFVEPHQGAATGVGGIVRDILAMGARPIAVMDPLRFGAVDHPDTKRLVSGIVGGVGGYGNCLGLPNIGGELVFDPIYQANPLLNALCLGVLPVDGLQSKDAKGPGNVVVLLGAKTGRDGIGGASILASATFDADSAQRRPSVQVGDPFMEKLLIESCLELYAAGLVVGIQDLGAAGISCALTETAAGAGTGMRAYLERVPLREPSMAPHEILASESQERMLLIVEPDNLKAVIAVAEKWGLTAADIGEVTDTGRLVITWNGETVVDVPPGSLADDGPVYARPMRAPADMPLLTADRAETLPRPKTGVELRAALLRMVASPNLCDKTFVTEQYDHRVLGNTVLAQPEDSGVIRIDEATGLGVALSVDGNGRYARLDPYEGAKLALAEAYRNVAVTGAVPVAVTNCLNFGSPEDPTVMWQFAEAVRGLADGCQEIGIPVTGGNVSFYNQTGTTPIHPTPVVGVLGVLENVADRVSMGFRTDGDLVMLLGETRDELSGSEWAWVEHGHLGGLPPRVDFRREKALGDVISLAAARGHLTAAHDLSDGGLGQALVESCLRHNVGARVHLPEGVSPSSALFSESTGRALVAVPRGHERAFTALCEEHGLPWAVLGAVTAAPMLEVRDQFVIPLEELRTAWASTLPRIFGGLVVETDEAHTPADAMLAPTEDTSEAAWPGAVELVVTLPAADPDLAVPASGAHPTPEEPSDPDTPGAASVVTAGSVNAAGTVLVAETADGPGLDAPGSASVEVTGSVNAAGTALVAETADGPGLDAPGSASVEVTGSVNAAGTALVAETADGSGSDAAGSADAGVPVASAGADGTGPERVDGTDAGTDRS